MNSEDQIEWNKCANCGFLQYKTHIRCLKCKNDQFEIIKASGEKQKFKKEKAKPKGKYN